MFADFFSSLMKYYTGGNDPNPRIFCFTATLHKTTSTAAAERFIKHSKLRGFWNYSLAKDQESQGTANRDFTWQTRHSSFSKFLAFMILLKCPIRWTSNYPSLNSRCTNRKAVNVWSQWSMMDWLGYLMTIKLRIWEQFPCGFFRANHLPTHHHHHHKHIRQHPGCRILACHWSIQITWPESWLLIGRGWVPTLILNYLISSDPGAGVRTYLCNLNIARLLFRISVLFYRQPN